MQNEMDVLLLFSTAERRARFIEKNEQSKNLLVVYAVQAGTLTMLSKYFGDPSAREQFMDDSGKWDHADAYLRQVIEHVRSSGANGFPKAKEVQRKLIDKMEDTFFNTPGKERGPKLDALQKWCQDMGEVIQEWVDKKLEVP